MNFLSLFKRKLIYKLKKKINIDNQILDNNSLDSLFEFFGSDKANKFLKNKNKQGHGFSVYYENELKNLKEKNINILEIGSYSGASAAAFTKFFSNSKVFCFDINISNFKYYSKNIEVFGLDINNHKDLKKAFDKIFNKHNFKNFDLIIDDGSHNLSDMLFSLNFFFKHLEKNGFFIFEDYKFPNYYNYNKNIDEILIDELIEKIKLKKNFESSIINEKDQIYLMNNIKSIKTYRGNFTDSDICFIQKKLN